MKIFKIYTYLSIIEIILLIVYCWYYNPSSKMVYNIFAYSLTNIAIILFIWTYINLAKLQKEQT